MIDTFTQEQFETALTKILSTKGNGPSLIALGLVQGEHCYAVPVANTNKRLMIRSSVKSDGLSADTGKDSIRLYVQYHYKSTWRPLAKLDAYTTRVPGWQARMGKKLRELYALALADSAKHKPVPNETLSGKRENKTNERADNDDVSSGVGLAAPAGGESNPLAGPTAPPQAPPASPFNTTGESVADVDDTDDEPQASSSPTVQPNADQLAAIEAPVNAAVRVLAGPGSGKTFCVARRYAYLLANGARPDDILAVTFNKTMADELLSRITTVNPSVVGTKAEQQVCTIHALCYRLLRSEGDRRNVAKQWQVKRALQDIAEEIWHYSDERPGYKEILAWVNAAKMQGLTTANDLEFFSKCINRFGRNAGGQLHEARKQLDDRLRRESLLTFADMLLDVERKLDTDSTFRAKCQARFAWVIVDEGQDTSAQAMRILSTLAEPQKQFYIVGDTDQLLYRFAGATPEANLFEGFEARYPDGELIKLGVNYRSTQAIVKAQLDLINFNYEADGGPYNQKYLKSLAPRPDAPQGQPVSFQMYPGPEYEAHAVVNTVREHIANDGAPGDIFIGSRTRAQLGYLEGPLTRAKIPFINITGGSFWASKHVADVIAYLRLAYDEGDTIAFKRIFNIASNHSTHPWGDHRGEYCHHRYLGKAFLSACNGTYRNVWSAVSKRRSYRPGSEDLTSFIQELQAEMSANGNAAPAIKFIVDECYEKYLRAEEGITADDESENGKLEDLATVIDVAAQFDDVQSFLSYVADAEDAAEAAKGKDWSGYVILSTVHRLKGLERPVVFGIGLSENREQGVGLLPHTFTMTDPPQNGILPTGGKGRVADDRCVAFVLVSRAQDTCHLSGVETYRKNQMGPSRFILEMGLDELTTNHKEVIPADH